jgi:hypothetical protein
MTKENLYKAAESYVSNNHSPANNNLQKAINIAIEKAFVAGALYAKQELSQVIHDEIKPLCEAERIGWEEWYYDKFDKIWE